MELELTLHIPSNYIQVQCDLYAIFWLSMPLGHVMSKDALTLMDRKIH